MMMMMMKRRENEVLTIVSGIKILEPLLSQTERTWPCTFDPCSFQPGYIRNIEDRIEAAGDNVPRWWDGVDLRTKGHTKGRQGGYGIRVESKGTADSAVVE